ncbi:ANTAR domain-containing response regulator [Undibacterium sp.]|uniref:ANTAR domain-containing response regulator n=1 Tax=Undibacterium sp. TaxID=1914977 RepID=UPI00374CD47F
MDSSIGRLYDGLRNVTVAVVYPPGEDRDIVVEQLKRIGCKLQLVWPFPPVPPSGVDVIFFQVAQDLQNRDAWNATAVDATLIALSDYENPTKLKLLLDTHAYGVITKPFRSSGILSTLVLAQSCKNFQDRQQNKIRKLEDTIKSRRHIEKAIRILVDHEHMSENQAYEHMRTRATSLRITVAEVSAMVIDAREAMDKLGLGAKPGRP